MASSGDGKGPYSTFGLEGLSLSRYRPSGWDDLEELLGYVAAEANHEKDRRRQKRLDQAFQTIKDIVDQS